MPVVPSDESHEALLGLNRLATVARLLSGAAHDVNNALQVISGTVEMLEARADTPAALKDPLARLRGQSSRAAAALAQVLQFARAARDETGPVNLRELADESLALRDFSIRRAGLTARVEALPEQAYLVTGNRADLQQALLNVLINAEQALRKTRGTLIVRLSAEGGRVALSVVDDGSGPQLDQARLFEPFVTTGDPFESAGLGLWAARLLVERHGGTLTIEAAPASTAFVMQLPERVTPARSRRSGLSTGPPSEGI